MFIRAKNSWVNPWKQSPPWATKLRTSCQAKKGFHLQVSDSCENIFGRAICEPTMVSHLCRCLEGQTSSLTKICLSYIFVGITVMNQS